MKIIVAYSENKKARVESIGDTNDLLVLLAVIAKALLERIAKEMKIDITSAEKFIIKYISNAMKATRD